MKKILLLTFLISFCGFSQQKNSIISLIGKHDNENYKDRDSLIKSTIDNYLINEFKHIKLDTLEMSYGLFFDRNGKLFISSNRINNLRIYNKFETIFKGEKYITPFKDSLSRITPKYLNQFQKYTKHDSLFVPIIKKKDTINNSFTVIEQVPIFKGCTGNQESLKKCMNYKIKKHIGKYFNVNLAQSLNLNAGKQRIFVQFLINKKGIVSDIYVRAPHIRLEKEAKRIIKLLPKMVPGKQKGKSVKVRYNLPIIFNVEDVVIKETKFQRKLRKKAERRKKKYGL